MGITALLPNLKSIEKKKNISEYRGQTAGIDTYGWIHKGLFTCAQLLAEGKQTRKHIEYVMKKIRQLQSYDITPVMIMDGQSLPCKQETEKERRANRQQYKERALDYLSKNDSSMAHRYFGLSLDVNQEMAKSFIDEFQKNGIECIIAPYEADSQLAYLNQIGYIDFIITEDSDLIPFGSKKIFYKFENDGSGIEIEYNNLQNSTELPLKLLNQNQFLTTCILSGCDYLQQINRVGIKTACKLVKEHKVLSQVLKQLQKTWKHEIPQDYELNFAKAFLTFKFQVIYDPIEKKQKHLNHQEFQKLIDHLQDLSKIDFNTSPSQEIEVCLLQQIVQLKDFSFLGVIQENQRNQIGHQKHQIKINQCKEQFTQKNEQISIFDEVKHIPNRIDSSFQSDSSKISTKYQNYLNSSQKKIQTISTDKNMELSTFQKSENNQMITIKNEKIIQDQIEFIQNFKQDEFSTQEIIFEIQSNSIFLNHSDSPKCKDRIPNLIDKKISFQKELLSSGKKKQGTLIQFLTQSEQRQIIGLQQKQNDQK